MSIDLKSIFRLLITRTVLEKWVEKSENHEILANFDPFPPANFLGEAPRILKQVLGTPFLGLLPGEVLTTPPDPKGVGKILPPNFLVRERPPKGYIS